MNINLEGKKRKEKVTVEQMTNRTRWRSNYLVGDG